MKRNKKLLVSFLALNAILTSYAQAETVQSARYERMYNGIVKNLEKGSSNEKTYQTIEKILNQKNKELKDLYLCMCDIKIIYYIFELFEYKL